MIDDDPAVRQFVGATLRDQGFAVAAAADGAEGLALAWAERPAAIVLDLLMPGLDGFAVLEHLRADARTEHVPVVVFSAKALTPTEKRWLTERSAALLQETPSAVQDVLSALQRTVPVAARQ